MKPINPYISWVLKLFWNPTVLFVYFLLHDITDYEKAKTPVLILFAVSVILNAYLLYKHEDAPDDSLKQLNFFITWTLAIWSIVYVFLIIRDFPR